MAVEGQNRHYAWQGIRLRHWLETGKRCGLPGMNALVHEVVDQTPTALTAATKLLPDGFPAAIADRILKGVKAAAQALGEELASASLRKR